jgi:hypothetical protein
LRAAARNECRARRRQPEIDPLAVIGQRLIASGGAPRGPCLDRVTICRTAKNDRAPLVRADRRGSRHPQQVECCIRRVPIGVLGSHANQSDRRTELPVEAGVLIGGAVVRHLHDVWWPTDRGERSAVRLARTEPTLGALPEVAEEHTRQTFLASGWRMADHDDAGVVAGPLLGGRRPDDVELDETECDGRLRRCPPDRSPGLGQLLHEHLVRRASDGADERRSNPCSHALSGSDVVGIEVGRDEDVDRIDAEEVEAAPELIRIVPGIDEGNSS